VIWGKAKTISPRLTMKKSTFLETGGNEKERASGSDHQLLLEALKGGGKIGLLKD